MNQLVYCLWIKPYLYKNLGCQRHHLQETQLLEEEMLWAYSFIPNTPPCTKLLLVYLENINLDHKRILF